MDQGQPTAIDELIDVVYAYAEAALVPVLASPLRIAFIRQHSAQFNARVMVSEDQTYEIAIVDGCATQLADAISIAGRDYETVCDTLERIARPLFDGKPDLASTRQYILFGAIIFVILHELSHALCGHFSFRRQQFLGGSQPDVLTFDEIDMSAAPTTEPSSKVGLVKQMEIEADLLAFEFMLAISYELLVANDHLQPLAGKLHGPDDIPAEVEQALAEAVLCACAAVFFLIEKNNPHASSYPSAEARILSLAYRLAVRIGFGEVAVGKHRVALDPAIRDRFSAQIIPAVLNALEFGQACIEPETASASSDTPEPREFGLSRDLLNLLLEDTLAGVAPASPGAIELRGLLDAKFEFDRVIAPYRTGQWLR